LGDFASPREVVGKIPQLRLVEMERSREESYCCGAGASVKIFDKIYSLAIGQERMKDFEKTGADVLMTACPLCKSQFRDMGNVTGHDVVVKDVVEILRESLA
jgi:Fe-S oxidoreductase